MNNQLGGGILHCAIPLVRTPVPAVLAASAPVVDMESAPRLRVLVVDDDPTSLLLASAVLSDHGHAVQTAETGEDALARLAAGDFDVVVLDIWLPGLDGYAMARRIRARWSPVRNPDIPIVAITAYSMPGDLAQCLRAGMDGYIIKPYTPNDLLRAVAQAANGAGGPSPSTRKKDGLERQAPAAVGKGAETGSGAAGPCRRDLAAVNDTAPR